MIVSADDIVDTVRSALIVLDADLNVQSANRAFYQTFDVTPEQSVGRRIYDLGNGQWDYRPCAACWRRSYPSGKVRGL